MPPILLSFSPFFMITKEKFSHSSYLEKIIGPDLNTRAGQDCTPLTCNQKHDGVKGPLLAMRTEIDHIFNCLPASPSIPDEIEALTQVLEVAQTTYRHFQNTNDRGESIVKPPSGDDRHCYALKGQCKPRTEFLEYARVTEEVMSTAIISPHPINMGEVPWTTGSPQSPLKLNRGGCMNTHNVIAGLQIIWALVEQKLKQLKTPPAPMHLPVKTSAPPEPAKAPTERELLQQAAQMQTQPITFPPHRL